MKRFLCALLALLLCVGLLSSAAMAADEAPSQAEPELTGDSATDEPDTSATGEPLATQTPSETDTPTVTGMFDGDDQTTTATSLAIGTEVTATNGDVYTVTLSGNVMYYLSADSAVQVTITPSSDGDEGATQPEGGTPSGGSGSNHAETIYGGGWYMLRAASARECTITVVTGGTFTLLKAADATSVANANIQTASLDTDITPNLEGGRKTLYSFTAEWDDVYYYWLSDTTKPAGALDFYSETRETDHYFSIQLKAGEQVWIGVENSSTETTTGSFQIKSEKTLKGYTASGTETITSQERFFKVTFPETGWYPTQLTGRIGQIMLAGYGKINQPGFDEYYILLGDFFLIRKPCTIIFMTDVDTTVRKATEADFITGTLGAINTTKGIYRYAVTETATYKLSAALLPHGGGIEVYSENGTRLAELRVDPPNRENPEVDPPNRENPEVDPPNQENPEAVESKAAEFSATAGDALYITYDGAVETSFTLTKNPVAGQLAAINTEGKSDNDVRDAVQNIGTEALSNALTDDEVLSQLEELEKKVAGNVAIEVTDKAQDAGVSESVGVVGVKLNNLAEESGNNITLTIDVADEKDLPEGIAAENAIHLSIELEGVDNPHELKVPVCLTVAVPEGMDPENLRLVHFAQDATGAVVKTEILLPTVYQESGVWYARFVIGGFSHFVLAQAEAEIAAPGETPAPTPTAAKAPKTGDESHLAVWALVLVAACGGTAAVIGRRKKQN